VFKFQNSKWKVNIKFKEYILFYLGGRDMGQKVPLYFNTSSDRKKQVHKKNCVDCLSNMGNGNGVLDMYGDK